MLVLSLMLVLIGRYVAYRVVRGGRTDGRPVPAPAPICEMQTANRKPQTAATATSNYRWGEGEKKTHEGKKGLTIIKIPVPVPT